MGVLCISSRIVLLAKRDPMRFLNIAVLLHISLSGPALEAATLKKDPAKFTLDTLLDAALPAIHPMVAAGSSKCEMLKNFFGITYEQMQGKNATDYSALNIDLITKKGNVKYNLTSVKRLTKLVQNATKIIVLVHGFLESSEGFLVQSLAPEFLKLPGLKILALDGRRVINLEYFRSSTHVRFMGEKLGSLLSQMIENGEAPEKIMLVGHSLGAHIAGIAGKQVALKTGRHVGRIAALDPAGPCFSSSDPAGRLAPTDAALVDVIHTNGGIFGYKEPVGHKDFFPNGGMTQPGCYFSVCDHSRAWELFAESITKPDRFPARKCTNFTTFKNGSCSSNEVSYMGMNTEPGSKGLYFLTTAPEAPFGLGPAGSG